jgi:hypothetical protein
VDCGCGSSPSPPQAARASRASGRRRSVLMLL